MTQNVGLVDRVARVIIGLALIAFVLRWIFPATGRNWIGWIGVVPILTAAFSTCPVYCILGFSTRACHAH